jgi:hypothetical protein
MKRAVVFFLEYGCDAVLPREVMLISIYGACSVEGFVKFGALTPSNMTANLALTGR